MGSSVELDKIANITKLNLRDAQFHKETIADLLRRNNTNFPGAQPVSFARRHLLELQHSDYFLCEKTDGIRCLLYLTQMEVPDVGPQECQFLIDRKNDYYFIPNGWLHMPLKNKNGPDPPFDINSWHVGTLLDGELVRQRFSGQKEQLTYLIFDMLLLERDNITAKRYDSRIGNLKQFVFEPWKAFAKTWPGEVVQQPFQLALKDWQLGYTADFMFNEVIPKLPHGNDGLIYTCKATPYVTGTDQHILKWKPPHENTVDFRLRLGSFPMVTDDSDGSKYEDWDGKPEMELLVFHGGNDYRVFALLAVTDTEWEAMKSANQMLDYRIIECFRDDKTGQWRPKIESDGRPRFRDDKTHANHVSVVSSVIESIEDAVSAQDLINCKEKIRTAWKQREKQAHQIQQVQQVSGISRPSVA